MLRFADAVVTVSDADKSTMESFCRKIGKHKEFQVIRNGYDEQIMSEMLQSYSPSNSGKYIITYAGSFYDCERDPSALIAALNKIVDSGLVGVENVEFNIYGHPEACLVEMVSRLDPKEIVRFKGMVGRDEVYKAMLDSHQLVAITRRSELARGEMTTKVYEYVGSKRSVICLSPPGFEMQSTLEGVMGVQCLDVDATDEIEKYLHNDIKCWWASLDKSPSVYDRDEIFSRKQSALKMMEFLKCL